MDEFCQQTWLNWRLLISREVVTLISFASRYLVFTTSCGKFNNFNYIANTVCVILYQCTVNLQLLGSRIFPKTSK